MAPLCSAHKTGRMGMPFVGKKKTENGEIIYSLIRHTVSTVLQRQVNSVDYKGLHIIAWETN